MAARIVVPRIIEIGAGARDRAAATLRQLELRKPLIVTDAFLVGQGWAAKIVEALARDGIEAGVFDGAVPDPTTDSIQAGLEKFKAGRFDSVIGFGGGSPIDTAKSIAVLAVLGGKMSDYRAPAQTDRPGAPIVAIPTTAGTGSEVTRFVVVSDSATGEKMLCAGMAFLPMAALVDFELTLSMPLRLTADTGIDTLTHAIESYVSKKANPFTDSLGVSTMRLVAAHLRKACAQPGDRAAREGMMLAATQGGMAFSNASVALVHGMSRPLGAFFHVPHGMSNAMLLPAVTRFSIPAALARYADCARVLGTAPAQSDDATAASALVKYLEQLNADLRVPTPRGFGIEEGRWRAVLGTMAEQALASGSPANNPRVPSAAEIVEIYEQVWAER
jgi:alcohol dehydrogenase class IV